MTTSKHTGYTHGDRGRLPVSQLYVRYYRKSLGDDFNTQIMRCDQYESKMGLTLDTSLGDEGIYQDKSISGGREDREGYNRLLKDIITGKLEGKLIVARDQERITRGKSSFFEEFTYNCERSGVRVFEATTGREIKDDVTSGVLAVVARQDRKRVAVLQAGRREWHALEGHPPTGRDRRFGYTKGYTHIIWEEAKWWRRIRHWIKAGRSLRSICKALKSNNVRRVHGGWFDATHISSMMKAPEYAALRTFARDLEVDGVAIPAGRPVAKGQWPAICTKDEHKDLVKILSKNKSWSNDHDHKAKYLLIGILVCDECGTKMTSAYPNEYGRIYRCDGQKAGGCGKVARNMEAVDAFILKLTYEAMKRLPKKTEKTAKDDTPKRIATLDTRIKQARDAYKAGKIDIDDYSDIKADLQGQINELKKFKKAEPLPIDDAEAFLKSDDMDKQRDTIRRLWPRIGVKPAGKGYKFDRDQLVFPDKTA